MMDKDPTLWAGAWSFLTSLSAATKGAIMAFVIAYLRTMYDGKETRKIATLLEALLCGAISLCAASVIRWLNFPEDMAIAVGGTIGFFGVQTVRERVIRLIDRKID